MTTPWNPDGIWQGETVAILGAGPDMTAELAATAKGYKTIAVNRAVKFAPWADMFVALDPHHPFWEERDNVGFKGISVCGVECDYDAMYAGMFYERVNLADGHTLEVRNNALAALRIAARAGASKIILLGFDTARYEWVHAETGFRGLTEGLAQMIAELTAAGIVIEQIDSPNQKPGTYALRRGEQVDAATFPIIKPGDTVGAPFAGDTVGAPFAGDTVAAPVAGDTVGAPVAGDTVGAPVSAQKKRFF